MTEGNIEKKAHHQIDEPVAPHDDSNGDEAGTTTSTVSTAVSSSSSMSSSTSTGSNKGGSGWKGMNLCRRQVQQTTLNRSVAAATSPRGNYNQQIPLSGSARHMLTGDPPRSRSAVPDVEPSTAAKILNALLISKKRLRFEPNNKLYFPYEPGKQSTSAVRIKNISRSAVAFKFQTTSPKSCFMRPPYGVLIPGESIIAIVVKFIELPKALEQDTNVPLKRKTRDKFKIVSLKIYDAVEFTPELFEVQKELVAVEQILRVVLLDPKQPSSQLKKLKGLMAEADAAEEVRNKLQEQKPDTSSNINAVSVLEEWKQRKLARQQGK